MADSDPTDSPSLVALTKLLRAAGKRPPAMELDRGLHALRARIAVRKSRGHGVTLAWAIAAAVICCVAVAGVAAILRNGSNNSEPAVAVNRIEGGKLLDGGYLSESGRAGIKLFFNEGSEFALASGTRGRLRAVTAQGAELAIEHGTASFRITKSRERRWLVEAGPFLVTVKGTDFTVVWDPTSEQFELRLRNGSVTVSGPVVGDDFALRAGQRLSVSLPKAETVISEERAGDAVGLRAIPSSASADLRSPATTTVPSGSPARVGTPLPQPSAAPAEVPGTERRWKEALANGQWDRVLADVEREGLDATLKTASSDELFALADAARYRRRADLARAALLAQRRRFPTSARSLDAAFLLGRAEEQRESGRASAIRWYDEYLASAPSGTYAAEALGRKMILSSEVGGAASAREIATQYLRRFPEGSYAGAARALLRGP
jgi:TolA-binding protein